MKTNLKRLALITAFGLTGIASVAQAQSTLPSVVVEGGVPTVQVSYADLALDTSAGMQTLTRRVDAAVRQVCRPDYGSRRFSEMTLASACRRDALADAWEQFAARRSPAYAYASATTFAVRADRRSSAN